MPYCNKLFRPTRLVAFCGRGSLLLEQIHGKSTASGSHNVLCGLCFSKSKDVLAFEVGIRLFKADDSLHFSGTHALTRVVVLLVGLTLSLGVADLSLKVVVVLVFKVLDAFPITPLRITVIEK
jgi:hypothetical protein